MSAYTVASDAELPTMTTWTKEGSPYIVSEEIATLPGSSFTIEPGTVIKYGKLGSISVHGKLIATGTPDEPIVFTSIRDDSWGGDTDAFDFLRPPVSASSSALVAEDLGGSLGFRLSDGSDIVHYIWASDASGGRAGSGYFGGAALLVGNPPIPYGSRIEAIVSGPQIDGSCPLSANAYTGDIDFDFGCAISYARGHGVPIVEYSSPLSPQAGDYTYALSFEPGSSGVVSNAVFRYGGGRQCLPGCADHGMVEVRGGDVDVRNASFQDGYAGLWLDSEGGRANVAGAAFSNLDEGVRVQGGDASVSGSAFDHIKDGIYNVASSAVQAIGDWWGDALGPRSDMTMAGAGALAFANVTFSPWLSILPLVGATSSASWPPWPWSSFGTTSVATTGGASSTPPEGDGRVAPPERPVLIVPGILGSLPAGGSWALDPIFRTYDGLIDEFLANGYAASSTLFTLPYDWRRSNADTARAIKDEIGAIKAACGCSQVDVVAHSMGGLALRSYLESRDYQGDIARAVFVGVPHRGAPTDYLAWEGGEFGSTLSDFIEKVVLTLFARTQGFKDVFDYVRHYPMDSVKELLPIYDYLREGTTTAFRTFPTDYPANPFLRDLAERLPDLIATSSPVRILNIDGDAGSGTVAALDVGPRGSETRWRYGKPLGFEYASGDGTVPLTSASLGAGLDVSFSAEHRALPSVARRMIVDYLTGIAPTSSIPVPSSVPTGALAILASFDQGISRGLSLVSPSGRRVGGSRAGDGAQGQIPGSYDSGDLGGSEAIIVTDPEPGQYTVETGSGSGGYEIEVDSTDGATTSSAVYTSSSTADGVGGTTASDGSANATSSDSGDDLTFGLSDSGVTQIHPSGTSTSSDPSSGSDPSNPSDPGPSNSTGETSPTQGSIDQRAGSSGAGSISAGLSQAHHSSSRSSGHSSGGSGAGDSGISTSSDSVALDIPLESFVRAYLSALASPDREESDAQTDSAYVASLPRAASRASGSSHPSHVPNSEISERPAHPTNAAYATSSVRVRGSETGLAAVYRAGDALLIGAGSVLHRVVGALASFLGRMLSR